MAEGEVRYCTAADGTRVAFAVEGSGSGVPTIIAAPPPFPYVRDRQSPIYPPESNGATCILDFRGSGLSDRNVKDLSLQVLCSDLEAVVDRLGWPRFSLRGMGMSGPIVLRYAATHADRVTRLVLHNTYLRASDMGRIPRMRALGAVLRVDWDSYCDLMALTTAGWDDVHASSKAKQWLLRHLTHEETLALANASGSYDVTALAPDIAMPTLVANPDFMAVPSADMARAMVARMPGARLLLYSKAESTDQRLFARIEEFLTEGDDQESPEVSIDPAKASDPRSALRTVLFTDLVGHTQMMQRLGDERGRDVLREHERITREVLKAHDGTEIKTDGDSFMISFGSVTKAVECAIALQHAFASREGESLSVRMGLNAGEPIEEDGDLFGATVILASRIAAKAEAGEILVADTVRGLCSGKGFLFSDRGEFVAKGFEEPVRVYEVNWMHRL